MIFDLAQFLGWIATVLFIIMIVPQIIKTIKTKNTDGVSLWFYIIFLIANITAFIYALMINQFPLIFKYSITILAAMFYISLYFLYLKKT